MSSADPTPADSVIGPAIQTILGYGVTGAALLVLGFLYARGWRLVSPAREKAIRDDARGDLLKEVDRLLDEKKQSDERASAATRFLVEQFVPLVSSFTDTTKALLPLLQKIVGYQEGGGGIDLRRHR